MSGEAAHPSAYEYLSDEEVRRILDVVAEFDPVVVGGQAVNLWVQYYRSRAPFLGERQYASRDVDFYGPLVASERLAEALGGKVLLPEPGAATPNAAVVVGTLNGRRIVLDFMATILGVDDRLIANHQV